MRKTHLLGTNNRTFCGDKIREKTLVLDQQEGKYMVECRRCLGRLLQDWREAEGIALKLQALIKEQRNKSNEV